MRRYVPLSSNPPDAPDTGELAVTPESSQTISVGALEFLNIEIEHAKRTGRPVEISVDKASRLRNYLQALEEMSSNPAIPRSDSGELERLLEGLKRINVGHETIAELKSLFERLQNRIAELERQSAVDLQMAGAISAVRNSLAEENERLQKENARLTREARVNAEAVRLGLLELASLRSENERLQGQCLEDLRLALEAQKERDSLRSTAEGLEQWKVLAQKDLRGLRSENERLRGTKDL